MLQLKKREEKRKEKTVSKEREGETEGLMEWSEWLKHWRADRCRALKCSGTNFIINIIFMTVFLLGQRLEEYMYRVWVCYLFIYFVKCYHDVSLNNSLKLLGIIIKIFLLFFFFFKLTMGVHITKNWTLTYVCNWSFKRYMQINIISKQVTNNYGWKNNYPNTNWWLWSYNPIFFSSASL